MSDLLLQAWIASAALMAVLWLLAVRHRDAGLVDVGWAASLCGMALFYAVAGDGSVEQRVLAGAVGGVWAGRLAWHLLTDRVIGKPEDGRYQALREHWGDRANLHFAWFFQAQALLAAGLSLPFLVIAHCELETLATVQVVGLVVFVGAKAGEALADRQLARWRADPDNRGKTCRDGLWRYSRHPNYFFEWLIWWGFALLAWPAPYGPWMWFGPVVMYVFVTKLTGIPYTEAQSIRSRGDDYRRYQQTTNAFFPWFPREAPAAERAASSESS